MFVNASSWHIMFLLYHAGTMQTSKFLKLAVTIMSVTIISWPASQRSDTDLEGLYH